jgi:hypothetical protein
VHVIKFDMRYPRSLYTYTTTQSFRLKTRGSYEAFSFLDALMIKKGRFPFFLFSTRLSGFHFTQGVFRIFPKDYEGRMGRFWELHDFQKAIPFQRQAFFEPFTAGLEFATCFHGDAFHH